jgi:hypothetical protein
MRSVFKVLSPASGENISSNRWNIHEGWIIGKLRLVVASIVHQQTRSLDCKSLELSSPLIHRTNKSVAEHEWATIGNFLGLRAM